MGQKVDRFSLSHFHESSIAVSYTHLDVYKRQGNASSTGIYSINNKERNVKLTGKKDPETGEPIYILSLINISYRKRRHKLQMKRSY